MSSRYINDRYLPDKAIDVVDERRPSVWKPETRPT